jgi:hypothetical protein
MGKIDLPRIQEKALSSTSRRNFFSLARISIHHLTLSRSGAAEEVSSITLALAEAEICISFDNHYFRGTLTSKSHSRNMSFLFAASHFIFVW